MTIAMGALSDDGLIIVADTAIIADDGSKTYASKINYTMARRGCYVISAATIDGNAAKTLVSQILGDLETEDPTTLAQVEHIVTQRMTTWSLAFSQPPGIQMILGAFVNTVAVPWKTSGGGLGLYFCEPPSTIVRKMQVDDSGGYVAIGTGAAVTDPIYNTLFDNFASTSTRLKQLSYLMYRAKKDSALCGGRTNAVFLKCIYQVPMWITPPDLETAEKMGQNLDFLLRGTTASVIPQSDESAQEFVAEFGKLILKHGAAYRALRFRTNDAREI